MDILRTKTAYYPAFHLGCEPRAVECTLALVEANGKRYVKTPFAMLDAFQDDDLERQIRPCAYYATETDAMAYLASEYPWWKQAAPIMDALCEARHHYGDIVGPGRIADKAGVSTFDIHQFARGHKRFGLKAIRKAVKALQAN